MSLLLDTHVLLWWLEGSSRLGPVAREAVGSGERSVWVSAASAWEIAIKASLGRLRLSEPVESCLPREIERSGFQPLAVSIGHALAVSGLPRHHADPFDRMLVVQARAEGLTFVTSDRIFGDYGIQTLDAWR